MEARENIAVDLHNELGVRASQDKDISGAPLPHDPEKTPLEHERSNTFSSSDAEKGENYETPDGEEPTQHELRSLERIGEKLPFSAFLIAVVELCERFVYYGASGMFTNYIMLSPKEARPGLGQGRMAANGLTIFFQFWCYVTPIFGAIIADQYLGRYKTILIFTVVYIVGLLILWTTALPSAVHNGGGLGGLIAAILIIGLGTGGIKSNIAPLIADQYRRRIPAIGRNKKGERVILDPAITIQRIYMIFYWCINLGSLSLIATVYMEKYLGFWQPYLLCFCMFFVALGVLLFGRNKYHVPAPAGSIITDSFKCLGIMIKNRNMNAPKPSWQEEHGGSSNIKWDDKFVDEVKRALMACKVFAFYPIYWICYNQFSNNFVTQALQMNGHGIPNDFMSNFDPLAIIFFVPILDRFVYPAMRKAGIPFPPINRIVLGFIVASSAMVYAAVLQHYIYQTGPCYGHPLCPASGHPLVGNDIHIAIQTPAYMLIGISEIFASVTALEYSYTKAPHNMKSFVQSMFLLTTAFGSAINEAFVPLAYDPAIMYMFAGLAVAAFISAILIYICFRHYNAIEEEVNKLG